MNATEQQLDKLAQAFATLDFSQPKAHECYRELVGTLNHIMTDNKNVNWREFRFYSVGYEFARAEHDYHTIPPLTSFVPIEKKSEGKPE